MKDTTTTNNYIRPKIHLRFDTQEKFFGPGVCELLELIDETGSVQKACARMELSYSKGSKMLKKLDQVIGISMVDRWAGGAGGGGARLTEAGKKLAETYRKIEAEVQKAAEDAFYKYYGEDFRDAITINSAITEESVRATEKAVTDIQTATDIQTGGITDETD